MTHFYNIRPAHASSFTHHLKNYFMEQLPTQTRKMEMKNACVYFMSSYLNKEISQRLSFRDPEGKMYFAP
ncbi:hypothetical protein AHMF7605_01845 [Adhaeribacter arboris]|uniref:Uncharacterized protein n=1 Tax=Adhaeribacter arboris TaxID=2072846 RepID=A0A2T2YA14_9BACT|nr:hypothetical protein AHMF7605_01845 [Adhaeribacter arboris]